jgi:hypothetical protein
MRNNVGFLSMSRWWQLGKSVAGFVPVLIGLFWAGLAVQEFSGMHYIIPDYTELPDGKFSESQKASLDIINELNKFLVSLNTALFGVAGFFINNYKFQIQKLATGLAYLLALGLLSAGYLCAFKVYAELTSNLTQGMLSLEPSGSRVLAYLKLEFIVCCGSSLTLLSIFVFVFFSRTQQPLP